VDRAARRNSTTRGHAPFAACASAARSVAWARTVAGRSATASTLSASAAARSARPCRHSQASASSSDSAGSGSLPPIASRSSGVPTRSPAAKRRRGDSGCDSASSRSRSASSVWCRTSQLTSAVRTFRSASFASPRAPVSSDAASVATSSSMCCTSWPESGACRLLVSSESSPPNGWIDGDDGTTSVRAGCGATGARGTDGIGGGDRRIGGGSAIREPIVAGSPSEKTVR
jgi:hypothetical protein